MCNNSSIGERLKESLFMKGVSNSELAKAVGLQRGYITNIIKGRISNPSKHMAEISQYLDVSFEWLMTGIDSSGVAEKELDLFEMREGKLIQVGVYLTNLTAFLAGDVLIIHDEHIKIINSSELGSGACLYRTEDGQLAEFFRYESIDSISWLPTPPPASSEFLGKVITLINRKHIGYEKIKFRENRE